MASIGELFVSLGFQVDDKKLKEFDQSVKGVRNEMFKMSAAAAAGVWAVNRFIASSVGRAEQLRRFTNETGFASEGLEQLAETARRVDSSISFDEVINGARQLADLVGSTRWGEFQGKALWANITDWSNVTPEQMIKTARQNWGAWVKSLGGGAAGKNAARQILEEVGLGYATALMEVDDRTFARLWQESARFITSPQEKKRLEDLAQAISDVKKEYQQWQKEVTASASPHIIFALQQSLPMIKEFSENMSALAKEAKEGFDGLSEGSQTGVLGFLGLIAVAVAPATAAIAGLIKVFNDLGRLVQGKDSTLFGKNFDMMILGLLSGFNSSGDSTFGMVKRYIADKYAGEGVMTDEDLNIRPSSKVTYERMNRIPIIRDRSGDVNQNNVGNTNVSTNIYTSADASDVYEQWQRQVNGVLTNTRSKTGSVVFAGQ